MKNSNDIQLFSRNAKMRVSNFKFNKDTISIEIGGTYIDLHNLYDYKFIQYNVEKREIHLHWEKGEGEYVPKNHPQSITLLFENVSRFAARERDSEVPFPEDNCINYMGFLPKDNWDNYDGYYSYEPVNNDDHMIIQIHLVPVVQTRSL